MKPGIQASQTIAEADKLAAAQARKALAAMFAKAENIHKYTRDIGQHFTTFYKIDLQNKYSALEDFAKVQQEIIQYSKNDPQVIKILQSIKNNGDKIEAETKINVKELLLRTWHLAKKSPSYDGAQDLVIDTLKHNIIAGGGCLAGISARLVLPYSSFVQHALNPPKIVQQADDDLSTAIAMSLQSAPVDEDEFELARAMSLSTKPYAPQYRHQTTQPSTEDLEMMQALILSALEDTAKREGKAKDKRAKATG